MATTMATTQKEENPSKTTDHQQPPSDPSVTANGDSQLPPSAAADADSSLKEGDESKASATGATGRSKGGDSGQKDELVTDVQKKIRRAERFGMAVQLSEEEKRNSRAERFGTGPTTNGSDGTKKSEEQKRKARAERFGIMQSDPADEEAKKKARLARFGAAPKRDTLEEEKKKARAIRFAQPPSGSLSQGSGTENTIDLKTDVAGKAGGGT